MKRRNIILLFILSILLTFFLLGNYYGPRMIIQIRNSVYQSLKGSQKNIPNASDFGLSSEKLEIITNDGLTLKAELIRTDFSNSKGTIIFVHGIRAYKEHFLPVCKFLCNNGFNSVIIDLRAHGESEGQYCTYGFKEKYDLKNLIDTLDCFKNLNDNYGIWGQSLGAAVALQTLEIEERLKFGIIESTFSDFETIVQDYSANHFGFRIPILNNYLIWRAENIGGFKSEEIKPSESAKFIKQRIFMVHGKLDKRIKFEYGLENFNNLASKEKEFVEIENANHLNVWEVGGEKYFQKVLSFINE